MELQHLERLIIDLKESLERDIQSLHQRFDEVNMRFDDQAARLERKPVDEPDE